jgi:hypothetical protein
MTNIFGPILPLQLDSRNTEDLVRAIQSRIFLESQGQLNDFTPASPLSAIAEGQAFAQSELLFYLNNLPEAFSLQWLRQLGIQRRIGAKARVNVTFTKLIGVQRAVVIPANTQLISDSGLIFVTLSEARIPNEELFTTVTCESERWGSVYNVGANKINRAEKNFVGIESITNLESATGGKDLESIDEMKQRAFEVLSRRNLTSTVDFENEVKFLAPESSIVKVLTYEERNNLPPEFSGNVVICAGDINGRALQESTLSFLINSMRNRVVIGTNISVVPPDIVPLDLSIGILYDPNEAIAGSDFYANEILASLFDYFNVKSFNLGSSLSYEEVVKELYKFDFIKSIASLDIKLMIKDPNVLDGACAGFSGLESEDGDKCIYNYSDTISYFTDEFNDVINLPSKSPITSYKLYRAEISLISQNDFSPLTYTFENLYSP